MIRGMLLWREEKEAGEGREKEKEKKEEEGKGRGEERLCTLCTVALLGVQSPPSLCTLRLSPRFK